MSACQMSASKEQKIDCPALIDPEIVSVIFLLNHLQEKKKAMQLAATIKTLKNKHYRGHNLQRSLPYYTNLRKSSFWNIFKFSL